MSFSGVRLIVLALSAMSVAGCEATAPPLEFSIGPEGGTLNFADGAIVLTFPEGAVPQTTQFTAVPATSYPSSSMLVPQTAYDIGPNGFMFAKPVTLRIKYGGVTLPGGVSEPDLGLFKVVAGSWELNPTSSVDVQAKTLTASISSLSVYGILGIEDVQIPLLPACPAYTAPDVPAPVRTFYVNATSGNDGANGLTAQTAWKTLEKANLSAQPGDLFLLSGTFQDEWISPATSGTASQKIVYRRATGATAKLQGGRYELGISLSNKDHVVVDGIELTAISYPFELSESHFNWLRNLYVHDVGSSGNLRSHSSNNRIEDSQFERIGNEAANTGDAVYLSNGSNSNVIARNGFGPAGHGAVWISHQSAGDEKARLNIIAHNRVVNPWANGIGLNATADSTLVECNIIAATANGTGANYKRFGMEVEGSNNTIRYNLIFKTGGGGISIEGWTFNGQVATATGNHIYHNTIWSTGGPGLRIVQKDASIVQDNIIENNIFWGNVGGSPTGTLPLYAIYADEFNVNDGNSWAAGTLGNNLIRNNIFESNIEFLIIARKAADGNDIAYTLAESQATFAGWGGNLLSDPSFVNPVAGNFGLAVGSPAVDAGVVIMENGSPRPYLGAKPDLGALEAR